MIAVLDVIAKVVYGLMSVQSDTKATDRDLAEGEPKLNMSVLQTA